MKPSRLWLSLFLLILLLFLLSSCMHIENHIYADNYARVTIGTQEQNKPVDVATDIAREAQIPLDGAFQ